MEVCGVHDKEDNNLTPLNTREIHMGGALSHSEPSLNNTGRVTSAIKPQLQAQDDHRIDINTWVTLWSECVKYNYECYVS